MKLRKLLFATAFASTVVVGGGIFNAPGVISPASAADCLCDLGGAGGTDKDGWRCNVPGTWGPGKQRAYCNDCGWRFVKKTMGNYCRTTVQPRTH